MKRFQRRDRLKIYGDLLYTLFSESKTEKIVLTQIQSKINVPFDRLKTYITEIVALGFVQDDTLKLTEKGKQYLREYKRILEFMEQMGISYT